MKKLWKIIGLVTALPLALFTLLWLATIGDYPVAKTTNDDPALPFIEINGYRFHGETFGDPANPAIIVVHGGPGWDYRSLLPLKALADSYFVVFYDQRGTGLSPRVEATQLTLESSLADLDAIVEKYRKGGEVTLIGHSWGAMLATAYLGREPHKVSHAVLAEPGFLNGETFAQAGVRFGPRWEVGYLWFATRKWFESLHIDGPDPDAAQDYFLGAAAAEANREYYCNGVVPAAGKLRWRAGATAMQAILSSALDTQGLFTLDLTQGLERFQRPVLLLASECNTLIGVAHQQRQQRFFTRSQLVTIPASGHMMISEQSDAVVRAVRHYLAQTP
ncbi:MAG TPA: alpha/beta hydrolase [Gammaproteobacteria bacterium]